MKKPGVYITKEQDIAIHLLTNLGWVNQEILRFKMGVEDIEKDTNYEGNAKHALLVIKQMNFDSLAIAIYDSYEVEKTPQEKLLEYYNIVKDGRTVKNGDSIAFGIKKALGYLGIEVEGIEK